MENKKTKWLIYTVVFGLIPIISRLLVWGVTQHGTVSAFATSDFIAFGLILHISNINEIEHLSDDNKSWKTGFSLAEKRKKKFSMKLFILPRRKWWRLLAEEELARLS